MTTGTEEGSCKSFAAVRNDALMGEIEILACSVSRLEARLEHFIAGPPPEPAEKEIESAERDIRVGSPQAEVLSCAINRIHKIHLKVERLADRVDD